MSGVAKTSTNFFRKIEELFIVFMASSFIGWAYEVFLEVVVYRWGYSDRGVLTGPYCPVYGLGAVILVLCLDALKRKKILIGKISVTPILVFFSIIAIATAVELLASYIMEWTVGGWMWDYARFSFNFQGRIAPNPSIRFGIGGMALMYLLWPFVKKLSDKMSDKAIGFVTLMLFLIFSIDVAFYIFRI